MSALTATSLSSLTGSALPASATANEPAAIRNGDAKAKSAYAEGLEFEDMLVSELAQQMTSTIDGSDDSGDSDGLGGTDDSSGTDDSDSLSSYSSLISQSMTQGLMSDPSTGLAMQIASSLDPSLNQPASTGASGSSTGGSSTAATAASTSGGVGL